MLKLLLFFKHIKSFRIKRFYNNKYKNMNLKLHIGCGKKYKKGWINIDNNSDRNIEHLDINYDISKGIPFGDNTVEYIFNEHFIEHLTAEEGVNFLKECKRVLKKGGVLRIATPDLEKIMHSYFNENIKEDIRDFTRKYNLPQIQTKAELININFHNWGHKWLYDREELERRLNEAGFKNIEFCSYKQSRYNELRELETRIESNLIAEATKE